jgi:hypothetical protein
MQALHHSTGCAAAACTIAISIASTRHALLLLLLMQQRSRRRRVVFAFCICVRCHPRLQRSTPVCTSDLRPCHSNSTATAMRDGNTITTIRAAIHTAFLGQGCQHAARRSYLPVVVVGSNLADVIVMIWHCHAIKRGRRQPLYGRLHLVVVVSGMDVSIAVSSMWCHVQLRPCGASRPARTRRTTHARFLIHALHSWAQCSTLYHLSACPHSLHATANPSRRHTAWRSHCWPRCVRCCSTAQLTTLCLVTSVC